MAPPTPIRSSDIDRLFAPAIERFGKRDIVVANAGVEVVDQAAVDFTEADYDRVFGINAKGAFFTLQQAAKHVADGGRIISPPPSRRRGTTSTAAARSHRNSWSRCCGELPPR